MLLFMAMRRIRLWQGCSTEPPKLPWCVGIERSNRLTRTGLPSSLGGRLSNSTAPHSRVILGPGRFRPRASRYIFLELIAGAADVCFPVSCFRSPKFGRQDHSLITEPVVRECASKRIIQRLEGLQHLEVETVHVRSDIRAFFQSRIKQS